MGKALGFIPMVHIVKVWDSLRHPGLSIVSSRESVELRLSVIEWELHHSWCGCYCWYPWQPHCCWHHLLPRHHNDDATWHDRHVCHSSSWLVR